MMDIKEEDGNLACVFDGKLDTTACLQVEKELLSRISAAAGTVSFDLAGVNFVASMFLRLCIQAFKELGAGRFRIVNAGPAVHKVFKLAGLDTMMAID